MIHNVKSWSLLLRLVLSSFVIVVTTSAFAADLTEQSVKQVIETFDRANKAKNAGQIVSLMTDDVELTLHIDAQGQQQVIELTKPEYAALLQQSWDMASNYQYSRSNLAIKMDGNKARVTADIKESMTVQGQSVSAVTKTETVVESIDGKAMITRVTGFTNM